MEKQINIDDIIVNYDESGPSQAHTVILMHGWGCSHSTLEFIARSLNDKLHVINVDLPGHGNSSEPHKVWGTRDYANLIAGLISQLGVSEPSVIGHSFGGRTAIALASFMPLNKLVLVDSAGIKPRRSLNYYFRIYSYKTLKVLIKTIYGEKKGAQKIEKLIAKKGSADYRASSPRMRAIMSKCVNEDLRDIMPEVKCPTLLIWGENDTATPLHDAELMKKKIPDAGLVTFPGCGHYSFLDNPFQFKSVLREFFKNDF